MKLKPIVTEKAVMLIESRNTLTFETEKEVTKTQLKGEVEKLFSVKVSEVRSLVKHNHKYFYVKLKPEFPAIDVATKVGMI